MSHFRSVTVFRLDRRLFDFLDLGKQEMQGEMAMGPVPHPHEEPKIVALL